MRILMVARRFPPDVRSGTETVFENLYRQARRQHDLRLVLGFRESSSGFPQEAVGVELGGGTGWAKMAKAALLEARRFRPDVVLANSIEVMVPGIPTVVIVHDLNFGGTERGWAARAREAFYRFRSHTAASIVAVSKSTRNNLLNAGMVGEKIEVIHNGVDLQHFHPAPEATPLRFLYPSRILPGKAQHLAIDAIGRMRPDQKKNYHLDLVGVLADRIYADQLRIQAFKQPVEFFTNVPDMAPYYQRAGVVLFPSLMQEGFGYTAIEGMACGKPVIWSEQEAVREATGGIGIAVPRDDADALKRAMLELGEDPERRKRVGEEGRAYVEAHYRWEDVWGRYERMLESLR